MGPIINRRIQTIRLIADDADYVEEEIRNEDREIITMDDVLCGLPSLGEVGMRVQKEAEGSASQYNQ